MENENQDFSQLKKLLALKRHEEPPPGYFNKFSSNVISRIRAERSAEQDPMRKLESEAPWLMRFWRALEGKPMFGAAFGAAVCGLVLAGILMAEKPVNPSRLATPGLRSGESSPMLGTTTPEESEIGHPMFASTNEPIPNLFNQIPSNRTVPVTFQP